MRYLLCFLFDHKWERPYAHGGTFRQCGRCGANGYEMPEYPLEES